MAIRRRATGLTLIELVVVVAIVALLGTIAVPSYRSYLLRSHRVEAKAALLGLAVAQERFYLQHNRYAADAELDIAPPAGLGLRTTSERGLYAIAIDAADAAGFTASATAIGPAGRRRAVRRVHVEPERRERRHERRLLGSVSRINGVRAVPLSWKRS